MYDSEPIRHPDDVSDAPDEVGPWLALLAATALLQDTRALGVGGVEGGPLEWAYAAITLLFPPVGGVYLCHRRVLVGRRGSRSGDRRAKRSV